MAFQSASHFPFVLLFSFLFIFNFALDSSIAKSVSINEICGKTQNPDFCVTSLEGFIGGKEVDLDELGIASVLLAISQARLNKGVVEQFQTRVDLDNTTKHHLEMCQMNYDVTLQMLRSAYQLSNEKDYKGMVDCVDEATMRTKECTMECVELQSPLSSLKDDNQKMVWLNDMALVILGMLNS